MKPIEYLTCYYRNKQFVFVTQKTWSIWKPINLSNLKYTQYWISRTLEGELVKNYIHQLQLKESRAFLLWPITVVHVINAESPLYDLSAQDCMDYRWDWLKSYLYSFKNLHEWTSLDGSPGVCNVIWLRASSACHRDYVTRRHLYV